MGTVPIWKQWLTIATSILLSPVFVIVIAGGFGWLLFRRLWPRPKQVLSRLATKGAL